MILSPDQVKTFWSLWAKACQARGWTRAAGLSAAQIDARRKELLRACGFQSLTQVDRVDGFTKVKNELIVLVGVSVKAAIEADDQSINKSRTLRHFIRANLLPCLALYLAAEGEMRSTESLAAAENYLLAICRDVARWNKLDRPAVAITLEDLDARTIIGTRNGQPHESPSLLDQVIMTLSARIQAKRKEAGDTLHEMRTKAGIECNCRQCFAAKLRGRTAAVSLFPAANEPAKMDLAEIEQPF